MYRTAAAVLDRPDTMFGICEAIGQDFGFNPNWLRVTLGVTILWNPLAMFAIYGALGLAVLISRLAVPVRPTAPSQTCAAVEADNDFAPAAHAIAA